MRRIGIALVVAALVAPVAPSGADDGPGYRAVTINTPGQDGHVPLPDFLRRTAGEEVPFGPHMTDQLPLYSSFRYKPGNLLDEPDVSAADAVAGGARIYRDAYGVPAVFGETLEQAWYGAGYALAQDRMWQMHLLRMVAKGRLSELVGHDGIGMDLQIRRDFYTPAEYVQLIDDLEPWELSVLVSYAAGVNQYIAELHADPRKMPAEIAALGLPIEPWTPLDTAALGSLMARSVASDGGQELENAKLLRDLVAAHGESNAKEIFDDLIWPNDPGAPTSVPATECGLPDCTFSSYPHGAPDPGALDNSLDLIQTMPASANAVAAALAEERALRERVRELLGLPNPGSDVWAVAPERSANGHAFLFNGPQVGYTMPGLLTEFEIHVATGEQAMDARGITVAGVPVVGIGYTPHHAWGLTSGLSDTIDLYVEELHPDDPRAYRHNDEWLAMECRTETFVVKSTLEIVEPIADGDAPIPPEVRVEEMCRTIHGPVIAIDEDNDIAYAQRYAMWQQELGTLQGLLRFPLAQSFDDFRAAVELVTWNENTTYADADGNIAYYHPGRYPARPRDFDERLPYPGTGDAEWERLLTFAEMPHAENPAQGWLANWNSKPSTGWTSGDPHYSDRPWGEANRLDMIGKVLSSATPIGAIPPGDVNGIVDGVSGIFAPDVAAGLHDATVDYFRPFLEAAKAEATAKQATAIDLVLAWDGRFTDATGDGRVDHAGQTIFAEWIEPAARTFFDPYITIGGFRRSGTHRFDPSPVINLFLRALKGPGAPLPQSRDYLGGKSANQAVLETLQAAIGRLETRFGAASDPATWLGNAPRVNLEVQGLGPGGSLPYQERGSWIEVVEYFTP